jgi:nucleoside-diphosphate-sugar epimerase
VRRQRPFAGSEPIGKVHPEQAFALRQRRREPPHRAETIRISNHRDRGGDHWPLWQIARGGRHLFIISSLVDVLGPAVIVYTRGRTGSEDASASARDAGIAVGIRLPRGTAAASFYHQSIRAMRRPSGEAFMTVLIIGGTGFIGRRLIPLLAQRGEESVVMDINPQTANFSELTKVKVLRGDVSQFDDVMAVMTAVKPDRVVNLAYYISSDLPPRVAFKLNILGMDNCFEAARLAGCNRVVYASSVAVSGEQKFYGERIVNEDDLKHGHVQYAMHKIFNEWQAQDYREKHGMEITTIRPANVTGPDKIVGSVDHVFCITNPARGKPVKFPYKDTMRAPIHVDEIAEIFARVVMKDKPAHTIYNTGGHTISLGELADMVREFLPDAEISFDSETGGRERSGNFMIDNSRVVTEFGMQFRPYRERVLQIINEVRAEEGKAPITDR